ncbi:Mob1/phocein [Basidiobolus meristosporus CBS 931.73]|uniref:Mob1/phocein n=1 Tax=Basidiobolus meristosporus CBS 931.73 TaxID=1314790 RepID=A0A1Y1YJ36_9FUNG|nr:Mob1/phocein [Basidiobolus meristosporus CBS 931.73]|eukprot:ORX97999.1 Mob1/phocein [Basidiobolus meristosporus CBS 931.73]
MENKKCKKEDTDAPPLRRNRPGTKFKDAYKWKAPKFSELDPMFACQEYLQLLVRDEPTNINKLMEVPEKQSPYVWEYEHFRQICLEMNYLLVLLQEECVDGNCIYMYIEESVVFCGAHSTPQECCPMNYAVHNLDRVTALLNSDKHFPSRVYVKEKYQKYFRGIAFRLYCILGHAWSEHASIFYKFEGERSLYARLMALSDRFDLIPKKMLLFPRPDIVAACMAVHNRDLLSLHRQ